MMIDDLIQIVASITLFEMMVVIGLGVSFAEVVAVARIPPVLVKAALANYLCVPAVAVGLLLLYHAEPLVAAGFLIAAVCPGAPYGPPFTGMAKGNVILAVGLMVVLAGSSALVAPLLLRLLLPLAAGGEIEVNVGKILGTLLFAQFFPLCLGLGLGQWRPALAERLKRPAGLLSLVLNLVTLGMVCTAQFSTLIDIPVRAYCGMLALVVASVVVGWLVGGPGSGDRKAMAMATGVRNVGVSLVIAVASFPGSRAVSAATAFAIFQTIVMAVLAVAWGRLAAGGMIGKCVTN